MKRPFGRLAGIAAKLAASAQALEVLPCVAAEMRVSGRGRRAHQSAAHIGIKRRPADSEKTRRVFGGKPRDHTKEVTPPILIAQSILTTLIAASTLGS